jgi:hypothetical protein
VIPQHEVNSVDACNARGSVRAFGPRALFTTYFPIRGLMSTQAQLAANKANALLSTGPTSPEGKAKSSLNAVKTALTGRTVLLPADDAAAYEQHVQRFVAELKPATEPEKQLVQSIADTEWRLLRIPALEMGIYALGRIQFANLFEDQDPALRPALLDAHIYLTHHRQLNNLSTQESRLRRQRDKDTATLTELQKANAAQRTDRLNRAAIECMRARHARRPFRLEDFGFEFSMAEIEKAMENYKGMRDHADHPAWANFPAA